MEHVKIAPSTKMADLEESPTLAITAKAKALKASGKDIIGFGAGEPDFDTPDNIKEAAIAAVKRGETKYTAVDGIPELKDAIIEKYRVECKAEYQRSEVLVSCGGKHSFFNLCQALLNPGDEVIVPAPYWVSYPPIIKLAGGEPVIINADDSTGFRITPDDLSAAITRRTKAVIINSPSNPTGAAYPEEELRALVEAALERGILIISDEIYEKLVYGDFKFISIAAISEEARKRSFILNGVSKSYSMTGWRIGYCTGPAEIIKAMTKVQSQCTSNAASISQWAAVEALNGPQDALSTMLVEFEKRRDAMVDGLNAIDGVDCLTPEGAFYAFPNVSKLFGMSHKGKKLKGSADLAEYLLDTAGVAVVPGVAFGNDSHIRLSYACSMKNVMEGVRRIGEATARLER
jgi:aspartate aminotransferase